MLTSDFTQAVRDCASLPNSPAPGTSDTDILRMGDLQMRSVLVPFLRKVGGEYYIFKYDVQVAANQQRIRLPSRFSGSSTRTVDWLNGAVPTSGVATSLLYPMQRIEPERLPAFQMTDAYQGLPWAFYFESADLVIVPTPAGLGTLRIRGQLTPGTLTIDTDTASVWQITAVAASSVSGNPCWHISAPSVSLSQNVGDVVAGDSPGEYLLPDGAVQASGVGTVDFLQSAFQVPPRVGDWVTLPGLSPVVQLPAELENGLVNHTAAAMLRARGRAAQASDLTQAAQAYLEQARALLAPRSQGNVRKVTGGIYSRARGPYGWRPGGI